VKVVLKNSEAIATGYPDLTPKKHYYVFCVECGDFRILNDEDRPFLYPSEIFEIVDSTEPTDWETSYCEGMRYSGSKELLKPGFIEDYFDGDPGAKKVFEKFMKNAGVRYKAAK